MSNGKQWAALADVLGQDMPGHICESMASVMERHRRAVQTAAIMSDPLAMPTIKAPVDDPRALIVGDQAAVSVWLVAAAIARTLTSAEWTTVVDCGRVTLHLTEPLGYGEPYHRQSRYVDEAARTVALGHGVIARMHSHASGRFGYDHLGRSVVTSLVISLTLDEDYWVRALAAQL